jgi:hypothetical protein
MTKIWGSLIILLIAHTKVSVAQSVGIHDTIRLGAMVIDSGDTLPHIWLRDVYVIGKAPKWLTKHLRQQRKAEEANRILRYNVYTVYPYAVAASFILQDVDSVLNSLESKTAKRAFKDRKEQELNKRFRSELEELSISQGQILVKLIARQTGKSCYEIIRELKGGFNATLWQAVALLFSNNLKNSYDPYGNEADIEAIVKEIESRGQFRRIP